MLKNYEGQDFQELVNEGVTLIDFFATWCGPCKMIMPHLEELAGEKTDVNFYKVDVEPYRDLAINNGVKSVPTLVLFKDGQEIARRGGFAPKAEIEKWINSVL